VTAIETIGIRRNLLVLIIAISGLLSVLPVGILICITLAVLPARLKTPRSL
jgi:hypothetical protein